MGDISRPERDYLELRPNFEGQIVNSRVSAKLLVLAGLHTDNGNLGVYLGRLHNRGEWVLPGGGVAELPDGSPEHPIDTIHRELDEEGFKLNTFGRHLGELVIAQFAIGKERDKIDEHGRKIAQLLKVCHVVDMDQIDISHQAFPGSEIDETRIFAVNELEEVLHPDERLLGPALQWAMRAQELSPRIPDSINIAGNNMPIIGDHTVSTLAA